MEAEIGNACGGSPTPPSPPSPPSGPSGEECTASAPKDKSCCNKKAEKCGENEGDCDKDSHCKAGLKCGTDNCPSGFPSNYDCCYNPSPSGPPSGPPKPEPCRETCGSPSYKGDNYCDDDNNNCGCEYDGGDCCGPKVNKTYCKECECKGDKPRPRPTQPPCTETCGNERYKGDNYCDDDNNNCGCNYDGGDCCGSKVNKTYCKECKCKQ